MAIQWLERPLIERLNLGSNPSRWLEMRFAYIFLPSLTFSVKIYFNLYSWFEIIINYETQYLYFLKMVFEWDLNCIYNYNWTRKFQEHFLISLLFIFHCCHNNIYSYLVSIQYLWLIPIFLFVPFKRKTFTTLTYLPCL